MFVRSANRSDELPLPLGGTARSSRGRGNMLKMLFLYTFVIVFLVGFFVVFGGVIQIQKGQTVRDHQRNMKNFTINDDEKPNDLDSSELYTPEQKPAPEDVDRHPPAHDEEPQIGPFPPIPPIDDEDKDMQPDPDVPTDIPDVPQPTKDWSFFDDKTLDYDDNEVRRDIVRKAFEFAISHYEERAMGADELQPISGRPYNNFNYAFTVIDAMGTAYIMGLEDHYKRLRDYVVSDRFDPYNRGSISLFESTIRVLGGLESAYALTGANDPELRKKVVDVMKTLLPAYNTTTGIPSIHVDVHRGNSYRPPSSYTSIAQCGTVQLELAYFSEITGNPKYREMGLNIIRLIASHNKRTDGLFHQTVDMHSGATHGTVHVGAESDSFYEYLVKMYAMFKNSQSEEGQEIAKFYRPLAQDALLGALSLEKKSSKGYSFLSNDHLACFVGGMYALGANVLENLDPINKTQFFKAAERFTLGCYMAYNSSPTGLASDFFDLNSPDGNLAKRNDLAYLRPEAIESCFYMWRYTHDQKYRDMGWNMVRAMIQNQKRQYGFSGLQHAMDLNSANDHQPSWFFAETLKYAFLLFSSDDVISLDDFVFNTEAHPLPINFK